MAKHIAPIGRVVGGTYDGSFVYWLIDKDETEYFAVSPNDRLRIGIVVRLEDNPITFEVRDGDVARIETKDEAFLHEDLAVYTKHRGRVLMRVNRQAADKLRSMAKKGSKHETDNN
ncbi:MAG: hypothetical protein J5796_05225 [Erysipelotrichaceae bacterium]|nr:hypothetical protein [Erysipelotrichaceae bacterium]